MYTWLRQVLPRVATYLSQVVKKKWELRVRFSPTKEKGMHQIKILTTTDKDGFWPAVSRSRLEQKYSVTESFSCVCVSFLWRNLCQEWVAVFVSLRESKSLCKPKANLRQKNQLYHEARCFFSPRSHRAVSLQVAPFLRDCKGRGFRRAGQTENE